jgi:putative hemolysin
MDFLPSFFFLLASATFSGAEASLFTLRVHQPLHLARWKVTLLQDSVGSLTLILFANLLVNLGWFAWVSRLASGQDPETQAVLNLAAVALLVVFGEILPKVVAHRHPRGVSSVVLLPVALLHQILARPAQAFGRRWVVPASKNEVLDGGEITDLLTHEGTHLLEEKEQGLVRHMLEMSTLRAGALRRPLDKVLCLDSNLPLVVALDQLKTHGMAWAAVTEDGEISGILDRTRLPQGKSVRHAMLPVPLLPELAPVSSGIPLLRSSGAPFVLLVDEYGAASGIIERGRWADTLLDRLPAKHLHEVPLIRKISDGRWRVSARLPLHDFKDRLGDPGTGDTRVETVGGLVEERLGRVPQVGDETELIGSDFIFFVTVRQCRGPRPVELEVHRKVNEHEEGLPL